MDITSIGLQASPNIVGNNASGAVVGIQQTNGANSAARNANVATENQPPASTRVTISAEGQARLAAEQASGAQTAAPAPAQEAALTPAAEPVTQTAAAAPVEAGASAAVGQGATQAAASIPVATATPVATPAAASATNTANVNAPTPAGAGAPTTNAQPATPETSAAVRQTVDGNAQQAEVRQNDAAAARQDASPVVAGTGANTARSALAA